MTAQRSCGLPRDATGRRIIAKTPDVSKVLDSESSTSSDPRALPPIPIGTMTAYGNVLDLIGNTPLVRLRNFDTGRCELYAKLESQNPGGSIKDRIGLRM